MKLRYKLLLICLGALGLRLLLLPAIAHPGIGDPSHYYNLGGFLADGKGYTIDYVWQYNNSPDDLTHPEDYWMPLTGLFPAASMALFGQSVAAALLPFVLMGALVPLIAYWASRQFGVGQTMSLLLALAAALLPEYVLNSLRTDTTMPNILLVCSSILLLTRGLQRGGIWHFVASGIAAGLAYQVRSDSALLLPMLVVTLAVYFVADREKFLAHWKLTLLIPALMVLIAVPWSLRNLDLAGTISTPKLEQMFYLTDFRQHFVYDSPLTLETLLASKTPAQLIGKRLFEVLASLKLMYTTLDIFLPVAVYGGLLLVLLSRDRQRLLILAPVLILILGLFVTYPLLIPLKSQGGSMKKAILTILPLLLPLAGYALERAISDARLRVGTMAVALIFLGANAVELVRADADFVRNYLTYIQATVDAAQALPDSNGDGEIILMAQDPFMLRFFGMRSVMLPLEDRDTILEVAQRYGVDYLMMPPDRPSLDPLYDGSESDPRFVHAADVAGTNVALYGFDFDAE